MEILSSRILIRAQDPACTLDFYKNTLGLQVYREFGPKQSPSQVFFLGGGFLEVSGQSNAPATDATRIWLQVADLEQTYARLLEYDVEIPKPPRTQPWGLLEMTALDPDGRELVFVQVPENHPLRRDNRPHD